MQISFCNISLLLETTRLVLGGSSISASSSAVICKHYRDADDQWKASGLKLKILKELLQSEVVFC